MIGPFVGYLFLGEEGRCCWLALVVAVAGAAAHRLQTPTRSAPLPLLAGLPTVSASSSTALKLFNWYTVPGWAAFLLVALLMVYFAWGFEDPTWANEHLVKARAAAAGCRGLLPLLRLACRLPTCPCPARPQQPDALDESRGPPSAERIVRFRSFAHPWLLLSFFTVFAGARGGGWRPGLAHRRAPAPG